MERVKGATIQERKEKYLRGDKDIIIQLTLRFHFLLSASKHRFVDQSKWSLDSTGDIEHIFSHFN
jgi:hypothetical protein